MRYHSDAAEAAYNDTPEEHRSLVKSTAAPAARQRSHGWVGLLCPDEPLPPDTIEHCTTYPQPLVAFILTEFCEIDLSEEHGSATICWTATAVQLMMATTGCERPREGRYIRNGLDFSTGEEKNKGKDRPMLKASMVESQRAQIRGPAEDFEHQLRRSSTFPIPWQDFHHCQLFSPDLYVSAGL
jgi:hypothetical protein